METDEGPTTNMADDEDAQPEVLLPCAVCGRKFNPRSLDKHVKICERTATKKRKPFDSAKQRIQGTELAEFLPKQQQQSQQSHHHHHHHHHHNHNNSHQQQQQQHQSPYSSDARPQRPAASSLHQDSERRRPSQAWKQSRDEFLRAIRAARGDTSQRSPKSQSHGSQSQQQQQSAAAQRPSTLSLVTSTGAPMRSNEKGQCPTCQRQFGLKSYDRHVAFCRERATRLPASPQTTNNVAKERLEARMKYRAPALRNRRPTNREKYSPGGAGMNRSGQSPLLSRSPMKDQLPGSAPSSNSPPAAPATLASTSTKNSDTASPKLPVLKRPGQTNKESPTTPSGPLKSRPMDRSNRHADSRIPEIIQETSHPPGLKTLFTSRRILLLSDVLPSKILQSKVLASAGTSPKSTGRSVPPFPRKPPRGASPEPLESLEEAENVLRKKIKLRSRSRRRANSAERLELPALEKPELRNTERDFVTWRQIREDARQEREMDCIDKEEEPVLSDVTGLSEGNSTTDEFEFNERMIARMEGAGDYARLPSDAENSARLSGREYADNQRRLEPELDCTYVVADEEGLQNLGNHEEEMFDEEEADKDDAGGNGTNEDFDNEGDNESSASMKTFKKEDADDNCIDFVDSLDSCIYRRQGQITESKDLHRNGEMTDEEDDAVTLKCYKIHDGLEFDEIDPLSLSMKTDERSPMRSVKWHSMPNITGGRPGRGSAANYGHETDDVEGRMRDKAIDVQGSITTSARGSDACAVRLDGPRCATYVIHEGNSSQRSQRRQPSADTSSDEKPMKKRRKLRRQQQQQTARYDDSEDRGAEPYLPRIVPSFSDVSSVRTEELMVLEEEDEETDEDTESNGSELLKEMDLAGATSYRGISGSQDSLLDLVARMRRVDLAVGSRQRLDGRKSRRQPRSEREELSVSSVELTDLTEHRALGRLVETPGFLPDIGPRRRVERRARRGRVADLETPREVDEAASGETSARVNAPRRPQERRSLLRRSFERLPRCDWNSYMRRHPDFSMILRGRIGASKDYDPFLLAEQQLNDLFSDTSDQSSTDGSSICPKPNSSPNFPLSHSSAFVKYPNSPKPSIRQSSQSAIPPSDSRQPGSRRLSVIAPPLGFDDLTSSDLSSDCTETHSLSREPLTSSSASASLQAPRELGRRLIIDQSQALGGGEFAPEPSQPSASQQPSQLQSSLQPNGTVRPLASRSNSLRVAPRPPERKLSSSSSSASSEFARKPCPGVKQQQQPSGRQASAPAPIPNQRALNGCRTTNGASSSLSLSSIISDVELKRSNSLFDELLSSFEEDTCLDSTSTLPSLMSLMRNESGLSLLSSSSGGQQQQPSTPAQQNGLNGHHARGTGHNGRIQCSDDDAELSSPESVKRQECGKLSADSAYSSLNRKYLHNGRSANELNGSCKYKLSKFCHECGFKFPDSAKFCCECGVKRLTL